MELCFFVTPGDGVRSVGPSLPYKPMISKLEVHEERAKGALPQTTWATHSKRKSV